MAKRSTSLILGITGEKSSGKSTVGAYLRKRPRVFFLRFSDVLNNLLEQLHLDPTDRAIQGKLAEALRATFGTGILARAVALEARASAKPLVVVDGIRKPGELAYFRRLPNFRSLYVTAPARLRFERAYRRNTRRDDRVSFAQFQRIERTAPAEVDIPRIGRKADFRIDNVGSETELFAAVDAILKTLRVH